MSEKCTVIYQSYRHDGEERKPFRRMEYHPGDQKLLYVSLPISLLTPGAQVLEKDLVYNETNGSHLLNAVLEFGEDTIQIYSQSEHINFHSDPLLPVDTIGYQELRDRASRFSQDGQVEAYIIGKNGPEAVDLTILLDRKENGKRYPIVQVMARSLDMTYTSRFAMTYGPSDTSAIRENARATFLGDHIIASSLPSGYIERNSPTLEDSSLLNEKISRASIFLTEEGLELFDTGTQRMLETIPYEYLQGHALTLVCPRALVDSQTQEQDIRVMKVYLTATF